MIFVSTSSVTVKSAYSYELKHFVITINMYQNKILKLDIKIGPPR